MNNNEEYDLIVKILLLGDSGVGKSNLLLRYTKDEFKQNERATVGVEFSAKMVRVDNLNIKAQIWDTAGMERYRSITSAYYRGAKGVLIVYDIAKKSTFNSVDKWLNDFNTKGDDDAVVLLIGNKCDLNEQRETSTHEAAEKSKRLGIAFFETSAKENENVTEAFDKLFEEIIKTYKKKNPDAFGQNNKGPINRNDILSSKIIGKTKSINLGPIVSDAERNGIKVNKICCKNK